ncbi:MAG: prolyl oligopeptidase family serine peptidase [Rickettsiales bacterium]
MLLKDRDVEYLLIRPKVPDRCKIVFLLHGFAQRASHMMNLIGKSIAKNIPNAYICSINGFHKCKGFEDRRRYDWLRYDGKIWDKNAIQHTANKTSILLTGFIEDRLKEFNLAYKDFAFVGFSQGTRVSLHVALRMNQKCAGVLGYSGALSLPGMIADELKSKPQILLIHGDNDKILQPSESILAANLLRNLGVQVDVNILQNLEHTINKDGVELGIKFLRKIFS